MPDSPTAARPSAAAVLARWPQIATRLFDTPLLIEPGKLRTIVNALAETAVRPSAFFDDDELEAEDSRERKPYRLIQGVAVVDVIGSLVHRGSHLDAMSGLTSYQQLESDLARAGQDSAAKAIMLLLDTGGGECAGAFDFADRVHAMRRSQGGSKPIVAVAEDMAASAGYLIASAAERMYVTQSATVGSIGVALSRVDVTAANAEFGVVVHEIHAGARKVDCNPNVPLDEDARAALQAYVDHFYGLFTRAVARNRGLSAATVERTEAGLFVGQQAVQARLADGIRTPAEVIGELSRDGARSAATRGHQQRRKERMATRKGRAQTASKPRAGENLARFLNDSIDDQATEDRPRETIIEEMAEAAGIEPSTVNQILNAEIDCPPIERLEGFAQALEGVSTEDQVAAAEDDGCDYSQSAEAKAGGRPKAKGRDCGCPGAGKSGAKTTAKAGSDSAPMPAVDVIEACQAAKVPGLAAELVRAKADPEQVTTRIEQAGLVRDVCASYGREDLAEMLVTKGLGAEDAKAILSGARDAAVTAAGGTVTTALPSEAGGSAAAASDHGWGAAAEKVASIYGQ